MNNEVSEPTAGEDSNPLEGTSARSEYDCSSRAAKAWRSSVKETVWRSRPCRSGASGYANPRPLVSQRSSSKWALTGATSVSQSEPALVTVRMFDGTSIVVPAGTDVAWLADLIRHLRAA